MYGYQSVHDPGTSAYGAYQQNPYGGQSYSYGGGYAVPQTTSYMLAPIPTQQSFYPATGYSSASFFQPQPYNPYDWSQANQGATSSHSFHGGQSRQAQTGQVSGEKRNSPAQKKVNSGKEAILVVKNIVNVPKSFGELGNGRYQVAAWCRSEDRDNVAIKKGYCTSLVSATTASSGDVRTEDVNFNYAKIRVPWDGEEVIQIKVFTDETVQNYQKTDALGTLALSLQDPDSKSMLAYPISGGNKEQKGFMYCTAELVEAGKQPNKRRGSTGKAGGKKNDEPWCFCL